MKVPFYLVVRGERTREKRIVKVVEASLQKAEAPSLGSASWPP